MATVVAAAASLGSLSAISGAAKIGVSNGERVVARSTKKGTQMKASNNSDRPLWFPFADSSPEWLDGSMIGDRGFDPLGLAKPVEYLQFDLDSLDQNLGKNEFGDVVGTITPSKAEVAPTPFQPYNEVFNIVRFRENEVIHGRWAMLAVLGALAVEGFTGVTWQDAGKVELDQGASYFNLPLPFSLTTLVIVEVLVIGYIEFARNSELDTEKRLYPGGTYFDPLGFAKNPATLDQFKLAELKHCRLAMIAALGFAVQAIVTGKGPLDNLTFLG